MAKLSHGPASHAVKASQGPPSSSLHFYCTNYSRHHGRHSEVQGELGERLQGPPGLVSSPMCVCRDCGQEDQRNRLHSQLQTNPLLHLPAGPPR